MVLDLRKLSCKYCFTHLPWWISSLSLVIPKALMLSRWREEFSLPFETLFFISTQQAGGETVLNFYHISQFHCSPANANTKDNCHVKKCGKRRLLDFFFHLVCPVFLFISRHEKSWNWIRNGALEERSSV